MATAESGNTVKVHYTGTLQDGTEFDASAPDEPIEVTIGSGAVIPEFENALIGMAPGETKTVTIAADDAYGPHHAERVQEVERSRIPPEIDLQVGSLLQAVAENGERVHIKVVELNDSTVTLDFNHPLAGRDLTFEIRLVEIV